jgi:Ca-activated chloride channel family protein
MSAIHLVKTPAARGSGPHASVLQSVRAEGSVHGLLFELSIEQCYLNASEENIEAVYTFPVPWNAVLLGVECILSDKVLHGTVVAKADGERQYEDALETGNSAVMVESAGDGMYTVNLGNLLARERAIVRFKYAQLLSFAQGQIRLVVPTVIGPRYGNPYATGLQPHQVPTNDLAADYPFSLSIALHGDMAGAVLSSPSHPLSVHSHAGGVVVSLEDGARLDRDVVVLAKGLAGKSVTTVGQDTHGFVALASFCPQERERPVNAALNLKLLVDCSGSMTGDRIDAARRALHDVLSHLVPADHFSFSCFGSDVKHFSTSLMPVTPRAIKKASDWVAATQADMGGTEIAEALLSTYALAQPFDADILLITDGDVWEADQLIASAQQAGQRIFAVGIGSAPAASLLHALASGTGGACECVVGHIEIPGAIMRLFQRMRQAPVRDVSVVWNGVPSWQTCPRRLVLNGDTVHHFAGFPQRAPASATLRWSEGADHAGHRVEVLIESAPVDGTTLARVAAAARMVEVTPAERHALALEYGLVSRTTNLILVHERAEAEQPTHGPTLRQVAHAVPAGWGGLGTTMVGSFNNPAGSTRTNRGYAGRPSGPAVWRREDTSAMFRVTENQANTYDIPAFLRKQMPDNGYLYRDELQRFVEAMTSTSTASPLRATLTSLDDIVARLPMHVIEALRLLVDAGFDEQEVIDTFILVLAKQFRRDGFAKRLIATLRGLSARANLASSTLERRLTPIVLTAYHATSAGTTDEIPAWLRRAAD